MDLSGRDKPEIRTREQGTARLAERAPRIRPNPKVKAEVSVALVSDKAQQNYNQTAQEKNRCSRPRDMNDRREKNHTAATTYCCLRLASKRIPNPQCFIPPSSVYQHRKKKPTLCQLLHPNNTFWMFGFYIYTQQVILFELKKVQKGTTSDLEG